MRTGNERHFWMGRPGLWRRLLTVAETSRIVAAHAGIFAELGYPSDADLDLEAAQADAHWIDMIRAERTDEIHKIAEARQTLADLREQDQQTKAQLEVLRLALDNVAQREARTDVGWPPSPNAYGGRSTPWRSGWFPRSKRL